MSRFYKRLVATLVTLMMIFAGFVAVSAPASATHFLCQQYTNDHNLTPVIHSYMVVGYTAGKGNWVALAGAETATNPAKIIIKVTSAATSRL